MRGLATLKMKQKSVLLYYYTWTVGSICPDTKEEEKEHQEEDQRAKPQTAKPQSPPNPPIRIHCANGKKWLILLSALQGEGERAASAKIRESFEITHVFLDPGCHIFKAISRSSIKGRKIGLCVLASLATFTWIIPGTVVSFTN